MALGLDTWETTIQTWWDEREEFEWGVINNATFNYSHVRIYEDLLSQWQLLPKNNLDLS